MGAAEIAASLAADSRRPLLFLLKTHLGWEVETLKKNLALYGDLSFRWGAILVM